MVSQHLPITNDANFIPVALQLDEHKDDVEDNDDADDHVQAVVDQLADSRIPATIAVLRRSLVAAEHGKGFKDRPEGKLGQ